MSNDLPLDPFWEIALCDTSHLKYSSETCDKSHATSSLEFKTNNNDDDDDDYRRHGHEDNFQHEEDVYDAHLHAEFSAAVTCSIQDYPSARLPHSQVYCIPHKQQQQSSLPLYHYVAAPLPNNEGIWSPLGAQAWYGSAILASMFVHQLQAKELYTSSPPEPWQTMLTPPDCPTITQTWLELGSGAVGLPSWAAALCLTLQSSSLSPPASTGTLPPTTASSLPRHRLILTDNEISVLQQLERNIQYNLHQQRHTLDNASSSLLVLPEIAVHLLDWNDCTPFLQQQNKRPVQIIFGSELVYTPATGQTCAHCILHLLTCFPHAHVVLVQLTDRDGWYSDFHTTVQASKLNIHVKEYPVPWDIDDMARRLVPLGGSLDRFDFAICCISRAEMHASHDTSTVRITNPS
jgi:hypothetical protein